MSDDDPYRALFTALCIELGFCLHEKGEVRVIAAFPDGLDATVRAVFLAEGMDYAHSDPALKRAVGACLEAHLPDLPRRGSSA